jgi:hypothetical protein
MPTDCLAIVPLSIVANPFWEDVGWGKPLAQKGSIYRISNLLIHLWRRLRNMAAQKQMYWGGLQNMKRDCFLLVGFKPDENV